MTGKHGSPMAEFTLILADNKPMLRPGRPRAVTPELFKRGLEMLAGGLSVRVMCDELGVEQRSWYRVFRPERSTPRTKRNKQALPREVVRRLKTLRKQGLSMRAIAERLGVHLNTLHKYFARMGLIPRRPCGCALRGRPNPKCTEHPPGRSSRQTTPSP